jgi:hypothetical protein
MALRKYQITSIDGGIAQSVLGDASNTYLQAVGIDPDLPAVASGLTTRTSGVIVPSTYVKFSGTEIDGIPYWIITQPKSDHSFVYTSAGKLHSFNADITMRATDEAGTAFPIAITGGAGNGAAYYNNFLYLAEGTEISQYGGLDQGASIVQTPNVWQGAKFSMATALTNSTYPIMTALSLSIPNHPMHVHGDNALYVGDVLPTGAGANSGRGCLHKIKTKRTTIDGDTNDGSVYNAIDLPYGYWPADIESYGTDIVIAAFQCKNEKVNQGRAELFFWDTFSDSFYNRVTLPDPLVTALYNKNGYLYVFSGNSQAGARVSVYSGGRTVDLVAYFEEGISPFAGAVDAFGERLSLGTSITNPLTKGCVWSIGSKQKASTAVHNTAIASAPNTTPTVTAIKYVQQANNATPKLIMGWTDNTVKGLDKFGSHTGSTSPTTLMNVWRSGVISIGKKFIVKEIKIPLLNAIDANTTIAVKLFVDGGRNSYSMPFAINNTAFPGAAYATFGPLDIAMNPASTDFFIELTWSGTTPNVVSLPITFIVDEFQD